MMQVAYLTNMQVLDDHIANGSGALQRLVPWATVFHPSSDGWHCFANSTDLIAWLKASGQSEEQHVE